MKFDFDRIIDREGTDCYKYDSRKEFFGKEGIIPMWVADMDFEVPPAVSEALRKRAGHPVYGYSIIPESYYHAFTQFVSRRHGWPVERDWILFSPGVVTALNLVVRAFTDKGDKVIVQPPVYFPFFGAVEKNNRVALRNTLVEEDGNYRMDLGDLEKKMKGGAKMLILCSPHNPVGRAWNREELEKVGELCLRYNVILLSDEIHSDLVYSPHRHIPAASLSEEMAMNTITCMAPSKTFNLAGLFTSSIIIKNEKWRKTFREAEEKIHLSPNLFGITAAEAAYREGDEWLDALLSYLAGNASFLKEFLELNLPRVRMSPLEATYLAWLDFRGFGLPDKEIRKILTEQAGVGLNYGRMFGKGGAGFQRMNLGCPRPLMEKALLKIAGAFHSYIK